MTGLPKVSWSIPPCIALAVTAMVLASSAVLISACGQSDAESHSRPASYAKDQSTAVEIVDDSGPGVLYSPSASPAAIDQNPSTVPRQAVPEESVEHVNRSSDSEARQADRSDSDVVEVPADNQLETANPADAVGEGPESETWGRVGGTQVIFSCTGFEPNIPPDSEADVIALVNGHPITTAEFDTTQAEVECNLAQMREQLSEMEEGDSPYHEEWVSGFTNRVTLMEKHGIDAVAFGGLITKAAIFTAALAAGHAAEPSELAEAIEAQADYFEFTRTFIERGHVPEAVIEDTEFDYDHYLSEVLPQILRETIPVDNWRDELTTQAWNREEGEVIWHDAVRNAAMTAAVTVSNDPVLLVAKQDALAYLEDYFTVLAPPPAPMPICANGITVPDPRDNIPLLSDCETLLAIKRRLWGTAGLNWSLQREITDWTGVVVGGTPRRVTGLLLRDKGLLGAAPLHLGGLTTLVTLDLRGNSVVLELPWLASLSQLRELWLSGNKLQGCIPFELGDLQAHDLDSLGVDYCKLPTPWRLEADIPTRTSVLLSWTEVPNASRYRVEYKQGVGYRSVNGQPADDDWVIADDTITDTSYTVEGLACGTHYTFLVRAYWGATSHVDEWSGPSWPLSDSTGACRGMRADEER